MARLATLAPAAPGPGHDRSRTRPRALGDLLDRLEPETRAHALRVAWLAARLAETLGWRPGRVAALREAAVLHDVGKLLVPSSVLDRPGPLAPEERARVRRHPAHGALLVRPLLDAEQAGWVRHHHERMDGLGYPDGLAGPAIPAGARVIAVADVFDAMTSRRPYASPRSLADALQECRRVAGTQLDARMVSALGLALGTSQPTAA